MILKVILTREQFEKLTRLAQGHEYEEVVFGGQLGGTDLNYVALDEVEFVWRPGNGEPGWQNEGCWNYVGGAFPGVERKEHSDV